MTSPTRPPRQRRATYTCAGGHCLAEDSGHPATDGRIGPYPDLFCSARPQPGLRHLDVGDDTDPNVLWLTTTELQHLRDGIGRIIGAVNDGAQDLGQPSLDDEGDGACIDWSAAKDGGCRVEFGDGSGCLGSLDSPTQLRELHERLALQLEEQCSGDSDGLRWPHPDGLNWPRNPWRPRRSDGLIWPQHLCRKGLCQRLLRVTRSSMTARSAG